MTPSSLVAFATASGAVALVVTLTGCVWLLTLGRCSDLYTCDSKVVSRPPRDNPLSAALATPIQFNDVNRHLTALVRRMAASHDNSGTAEPSCASVPSIGCSYTIVLTFIDQPNTCNERTYTVSAGAGDGPVVNTATARPIGCQTGVSSGN